MIDTTMTQELYIVKTKQGMHQLRMTFNKDCLATDLSLDGILAKLERALKRYNSPDDLYIKMRDTEMRKMSPIELERQEKIYNEQGTDYIHYIEEAIDKLNKGMQIHRQNFIKKKKVTVNKVTPILDKEAKVEPVTTNKKLLAIKKRKVTIK